MELKEEQIAAFRELSAQASAHTRAAYDRVRALFRQQGLDFQSGDEELLTKEPPKKPPFPFLIILIALLKDVLDSLDLTIIGMAFTTILSFVFTTILFFWVHGRMKGGWWKKGLIRFVWRRFFIVALIESVPLLKLIPANTIFIFMVHHREERIVKIIDRALDELKKAGVLGASGVSHLQGHRSGGGSVVDFRKRRGSYERPAQQPEEGREAA